MAELDELKKIKKLYGEKFMHLCRELFTTLLEQEGRLYEIITSLFSGNCKTLYEDIVKAGLEEEFKDYIYSKIDVENPEKKIIEEKTPYELLKEAGYTLTECLTEEEIQQFKKYYKPGEELCTFRGGRLDRCVVFWAVKENAKRIRRENFKNPKREDEYGTSVMGIQFNKKGTCMVSIKNRYNHTVNNPDATYGNDLDRIIPGLTKSFATLLNKEYGLELNTTNVEEFEMDGYVVANDGKHYKYNMEINGIYYCPDNIIIENGEPQKLKNPESQILMDYFILDTKNKTIRLYDSSIYDSFADTLQGIEKVEIVKLKEENANKIIKIYKKEIEEPVLIGIDKNNQVVKYENKDITRIGDDFLKFNKGLMQLELPNLEEVGSAFLYENEGLTKLDLPKLEQVGNYFLKYNRELTQLKLPKLEQVGDYFLRLNRRLTQLELPNLKEVGRGFLLDNLGLTQLELPNLERVGNAFLFNNEDLTKLELPKLEQVGNYFLYHNQGLTQLNLAKLPQIREEILARSKRTITSADIANLDKENELTSSEVNLGRRIIEKIKSLLKRER